MNEMEDLEELAEEAGILEILAAKDVAETIGLAAEGIAGLVGIGRQQVEWSVDDLRSFASEVAGPDPLTAFNHLGVRRAVHLMAGQLAVTNLLLEEQAKINKVHQDLFELARSAID